ncbi:DUF2935 domain-containing protein [Alicyclobacillus sp.]|uniref:DUF2935 domain-containing protein n=1 Tax=Alicyclobacillus sp. TaxID=61169 RepID=UPI0025C2B05C|nr:DUF2935 domain-containing protein [Alicyclobacillus sp.]MCL6515691.1 DUF2935 domain-containing protein [Alicyclobacillus sp.]
MPDVDLASAAGFEHRFWLQVLGDHARFIHDALSSRETREIQRARAFMDAFDELLEQARRTPSGAALAALNQQALHMARQIRAYKLHLLRRHLRGEIALSLPPTFLNHMVNEVEEYLRILRALVAGRMPPRVHPVHHHLLWLLDAAGHSATLSDLVDPTEKRVMEKSDRFTQVFEAYYLKAVELAGYLRTRMEEFPALARFNQEVNLEIRLFSDFLHELAEMELDDRLLGALSPLMPDHMAREECYYLLKLAESSNIPAPACDPTRPRTEEPLRGAPPTHPEPGEDSPRD